MFILWFFSVELKWRYQNFVLFCDVMKTDNKKQGKFVDEQCLCFDGTLYTLWHWTKSNKQYSVNTVTRSELIFLMKHHLFSFCERYSHYSWLTLFTSSASNEAQYICSWSMKSWSSHEPRLASRATQWVKTLLHVYSHLMLCSTKVSYNL